MFFLKNGITIPETGFGTWQIEYGDICVKAVKEALKAGYRLIDTARAYGNEKSVGIAVKEALAEGIIKDRSEVFVTSKLWNTDRSYNKVFKAFEKTMRNLELDYIDLYLIHWPANRKRYKDPERVNAEVWRAFEELYEAGKIRAIGVSNFYPDRLVDLVSFSKIPPMVNQIETHVLNQRQDDKKWMDKYNVIHEAWAPFGEGKGNLFENEILKKIGEKYNKTTGQVMLRWNIQRGISVLPKTVSKERMLENISVFDFSLSDEDMKAISALDTQTSLFFSHYDPSIIEWFVSLVDQRRNK